LPKDVRALASLARANGIDHAILEAIEQVNERQKTWAPERLLAHFGGSLTGKRIALWGIAFKPKTDDIRHAPALTIARCVLEAGGAVCAYDPEAMGNARQHFAGRRGITFADDPYDACDGADALCLATEWGIFRSPDWSRLRTLMRTHLIVDGRNQYDPDELRRLGFTHIGIGRPHV
jgi:UDPglucose 6-dehydrogenase